MASRPVADGELAGIFSCLSSFRAVALAVSGGPDSMALMHLCARWARAAAAPGAMVLTVDHGLRPEAAAEAQAVAAEALRLGFSSAVLTWVGEKPKTGLQKAAREARYRLMAEAAAEHGLEAIVTAHTEDDQAETLLMRLARGSGLDGLAGMPEQAVVAGVPILRPFLGLPKARLVATLEAASIRYITDPSNTDPRFERSRLRAAAPVLQSIGLTSENLARSARRLERARRTLEQMTDEQAQACVEVSALGVATVDLDQLAQGPDDIVVRITQRLVAATGGDVEPPSLAQIEQLASWLVGATGGGRTLGRAEISVRARGGRRQAIFLRETGRRPPATTELRPGTRICWDGRFRIGLAKGAEAILITPGADLPDDLSTAMAERPRPAGFDAAPFAVRNTTLVAAPWDAENAAKSGLDLEFLGLSTILSRTGGPKPKNKPYPTE